MSSTKYISTEVEISLDEWDDDELIKEIKSRGYKVGPMPEIVTIEDYWNTGNKKEALILLEREFPDLRGISQLLN